MSEAITEQMLTALRAEMERTLSPTRFAHTKGVERMAAFMAQLYCPTLESELRAAALLHDSTKEYTDARQLEILAANGVALRPDEARAPKIWHAMTAALEIPVRYPVFATPTVLGAVRWHTTGRADMTQAEAILYLADLIEENRNYPALVALRNRFLGADPKTLAPDARLVLLHEVLCAALAQAAEKLGEGACADTLSALNYETDVLKGK